MSRPHRSSLRIPGAALLLACALAAAPARGQEGECPEGRITGIFVDNHSVFDLTDPDRNKRLDRAYRVVNWLHVPTREGVIRRELLFREGDCFDEERLRESERILRASTFIARVDIYAVPQPDGNRHVVVDTHDEWSTRVEVQVNGSGEEAFGGIRLRDVNLLGSGRMVSAFSMRLQGARVWGVAASTPQLVGTRWDMHMAAGRTPTGYLLSESIFYPFLGESGRWAARQHFTHHDRYFQYVTVGDSGVVRILLPERRRAFDVGGLIRTGRRGSLTLLGAAVVGEWISYEEEPRFSGSERREGEVVPDSLFDPLLRMDSVSSVRVELLAGKRKVRFVRRNGLDALRSTEDVRLGTEVEIGVGHAVPALSSDDDLSIDFGVTAAGELGGAGLGGVRLVAEAKRDQGASPTGPKWNDVFAQLDLWGYLRPSPGSRHTLVAALAGAGGWNTTIPFQLTLGGGAGLRGYPHHVDPGGRRLVGSVELRTFLGWPAPDLLDLGAVAFVDVGRIWPGDVPFGVYSPYRTNVGLGLRGAFPPGSRSTYRLDVGLPISGEGGVVVSLGVGQAIGMNALGESRQIARSSRRGISSSLFNFPN